MLAGGRMESLAHVVVAMLLLGAAPSRSEAVRPPTGSRPAVLFFQRNAAAYTRVPGVSMVETGYFFVRPEAHKAVGYWWGSIPPAGYSPAKATISARLDSGLIVAYLAELSAPGIRRLRIVMAGGSVFTSTTRCWRESTATASPLGTGERYLFNDGGAHFAPRSGNSVRFTYGWRRGATATETNVFTGKRPSRVSVSIEVAGPRPMSIHESIVPLAEAPPLPVPSPPALPTPKPLCK